MNHFEETYTIISASGIRKLDEDMSRFTDINVCAICNLKSDISLMLDAYEPQCIIISDNIQGEEELIELMINEHIKHPNTRFIYLAGELDSRDTARIDQLGTLVLNGIYDIIFGKINPHVIHDAVLYPKMREAVNHLTHHLLNKKAEIRNASGCFVYEGFSEETVKEADHNLFMVWSPKPGSGKSFISANLAVACAKYGLNKPKVALIDGDLQNLSIGNILGIKPDEKRNLRTAMIAITDILNGSCSTEERKRRAEKTVRECFVRYSHLANLDVLAGSFLTPTEIDGLNITHNHYRELLRIIEDVYDIVIVDLNSSVTHTTTYEMMKMSKEIYCVINLDYNNILNSSRYSQTIKAFQVEDKLKYILNQDILNESGKFGTDLEELSFTADNVEEQIIHLTARIPNVEPSIFFNRQFEGIPIVLYKRPYTNRVRLAFLELAQGICEIDPDTIRKLKERVSGEKKPLFSFFNFKKNKEPKPIPEKPNFTPPIPLPNKEDMAAPKNISEKNTEENIPPSHASV